MCETLSAPVVGGNVSLYNDSATGPILPTPTLALVGTKDGYDAPPLSVESEGELLLVGDRGLEADGTRLGGSEYLAQFGGSDAFPSLPETPSEIVETLAAVANDEATLAVHDVSHGGLAVSLAEMVSEDAGLEVSIPADSEPAAALPRTAGSRAGPDRLPAAVREAFDGVAPVVALGEATDRGTLELSVGDRTLERSAGAIRSLRDTLEAELE